MLSATLYMHGFPVNGTHADIHTYIQIRQGITIWIFYINISVLIGIVSKSASGFRSGVSSAHVIDFHENTA